MLDPTWPEPKQRITDLCKYLDKVSDLIAKKGKLRSKRLQTLIKSMKEKDLGKYVVKIMSGWPEECYFKLGLPYFL